ncbi:NUDIX hydrolase [Ancylobacter defluvii]|uniref:NUDIX hydrolase n=1 Tax=Ancylobacter defluvii TaxID=1282440 RepID=A0A9W6NBB6_9HYPH|nr:NUDIX hydrolase [Ancylobacter defluvii]MBS7586053.1 NUDIX hydrolase [Ancylobacter defluvii]GLK84432.1 NUDIX hydrolase [Ancylobacter defluvii]
MAKKKKKLTKLAASGRTLEQIAALPFRVSPEGQLEILLLTSRETHRAVIPKGWPIKNHKDWKSAQVEARQEAGVIGEIGRKPFGEYRYWKRLDQHFALIKVEVFPLAVTRQLADWPERHERVQRWFQAEGAALLIDEPELGDLIRDFAESKVWRKPAERK